MGIEDIEIPEVPIPVRILAEKRAANVAPREPAKKNPQPKSRSNILFSSFS